MHNFLIILLLLPKNQIFGSSEAIAKMGSVCQKQHSDLPYRSAIKEISSTISQNIRADPSEMLELLTLTSQNSFSYIEELDLVQNKFSSQRKTIADFKPIRVVGKGAFGEVFLVQDKMNNKNYAMKVINKKTIKNENQKTNALSQRYLLEAMDNNFIVKLHYAFQSHNKLYLLVDFMAGGQLFYLLRRQKVFEEKVAKFYAAQILLALGYLHNRNVIYRDLKPENILLSKQGHIKLADFGLSKICFNKNQLAFSICGTPQYIAPEIVQCKGYDQSADWFSFGSVIYDMLTGKPPFFSKNKHEILKNIATRQVPIPSYLSPQAQSLLKGLFKIKPSARLGYKFDAKQIKEHQFFKDIDFEELEKLNVQPPVKFENCQINIEGFDQELQDQKGKLEMDLSPQTLGKQGIFKDFQYFKPEDDSLSYRCQSFQFVQSNQDTKN